jgi:DNA-directed RNA polymerase specialized sigma24 family protein
MIVRRCCYDRLRKMGTSRLDTDFDETVHSRGRRNPNQERALLLAERTEQVRRALAELPTESRKALILRELEQIIVPGNCRHCGYSK